MKTFPIFIFSSLSHNKRTKSQSKFMAGTVKKRKNMACFAPNMGDFLANSYLLSQTSELWSGLNVCVDLVLKTILAVD